MSKWYEVRVSIWKTAVVELGDDEGEELAMNLAYEEFLGGDDGEVSEPKLLTTDQELNSAKRHANVTLQM
jgi:hypothetical protein